DHTTPAAVLSLGRCSMHPTIRNALWLTAIGVAALAVRAAAADDDPIAPYRYPKAEASPSSQSGTMYCGRETSPDDFNKVVEFYRKKFGLAVEASASSAPRTASTPTSKTPKGGPSHCRSCSSRWTRIRRPSWSAGARMKN